MGTQGAGYYISIDRSFMPPFQQSRTPPLWRPPTGEARASPTYKRTASPANPTSVQLPHGRTRRRQHTCTRAPGESGVGSSGTRGARRCRQRLAHVLPSFSFFIARASAALDSGNTVIDFARVRGHDLQPLLRRSFLFRNFPERFPSLSSSIFSKQ